MGEIEGAREWKICIGEEREKEREKEREGKIEVERDIDVCIDGVTDTQRMIGREMERVR